MADVAYSPSGLDPSDPQTASKDRTPTPDYTPTAAEEKLIKKLTGKFLKAKKNRERFDQKWIDYYKMFRGKQWDDLRPPFRHSEVINQIFKIIQSTVPIMTDSKPRVEFLPQDPTDLELNEILNQLLDWDWTRQNWLYSLTEVIYDSHFYGTGLSKITFNQSADAGVGRIEYKSVDPFYCYPSPTAKDTNSECREFFYAEILDIEEIKRRYPDKGRYVKGATGTEAVMNRASADVSESKYQSPTDNYIYTQENPKSYGTKKETVLFECWWDDDEFEETKKESVSEESGELVVSYEQVKKYPNGRLTVWADNIILVDKPNPIEEGITPYERLINYINPREFFGISEIENLESPQKIFNKLVSFTLDVLTLMGNPIWIVDSNSGVDVENIYNRPGEIVTKNVGSEVRRESGTQLQPYVLQIIDKYKIWIDELSGSQDITRGVRPEGVSAALAIQELQQAAQTRIRQKSRFLDNYLQTLGQHWLALAFQYYTVPLVVRVTNRENPELQNYFKFYIEEVQDESGENKRQARVTPYNRTDDGKYLEGDERTVAINKKFDVRVTTGSSLPFSKLEKEQRLFNLYDRQIIDAEQVLKDLEYPNWQAILARMQQRQMEAAIAADPTSSEGNGTPNAPTELPETVAN